MKRRLVILFILLSGIFVSKEIYAQEIKFKNETCDFGIVQTGNFAECVFEFKNTGKAPLIISEVRGLAEWSKEPIKPQKSAVIKVKYDKSYPRPINQSITVLSNAKKQPTTILRIKGTIENPK